MSAFDDSCIELPARKRPALRDARLAISADIDAVYTILASLAKSGEVLTLPAIPVPVERHRTRRHLRLEFSDGEELVAALEADSHRGGGNDDDETLVVHMWWSRSRSADLWFDEVVPRVQPIIDARAAAVNVVLHCDSISISEKAARRRAPLRVAHLAVERTGAPGSRWDGLFRMVDSTAIEELRLAGPIPPSGFDAARNDERRLVSSAAAPQWPALRTLCADLSALACVDVLTSLVGGFAREGLSLSDARAPSARIITWAPADHRFATLRAILRRVGAVEWVGLGRMVAVRELLRRFAELGELVEQCATRLLVDGVVLAPPDVFERASAHFATLSSDAAAVRTWMREFFPRACEPETLDEALASESDE